MPVVLGLRGLRFSYCSNEGSPLEPPHIHVEAGGREAKFWLRPEVRIAYNDGFDSKTLRELLRVVEVNCERIERGVEEFLRLGRRTSASTTIISGWHCPTDA